MLRKTLKNDMRSNDKYFEIVSLKKLIYMLCTISYSIIVSCVSIKNINFISMYLLLSYIKYY